MIRYFFMRAIIVDDIKQARKALHHDLIDYCEEVQVVGEADNVSDAISLINELKPDLVFLDIDLGNNTTGFDIISSLTTQPNIIFTFRFWPKSQDKILILLSIPLHPPFLISLP